MPECFSRHFHEHLKIQCEHVLEMDIWQYYLNNLSTCVVCCYFTILELLENLGLWLWANF